LLAAAGSRRRSAAVLACPPRRLKLQAACFVRPAPLRLRAVGLFFGGRRGRGRISGRARGVAVASTLLLVARRAAQLTFPCGAFVFFLSAFYSILVLVAIVR